MGFNAFTQPHPPSTRNKPALAFGLGGGPKGPKGLNIQLSDEEDEFDKFMPPSRDQFEKQYGDTILADYDDDEEEQTGEQSATMVHSHSRKTDNKKDEEAPKPTADVMMSRNLKGGAGKGFNFAFSSDGEDSQESPTKINNGMGNSFDDQNDLLAPQPPKFGSRPINLLSQKASKGRGGTSGAAGVRKGFIKPLITTDEDQLDSLFIKNDQDRQTTITIKKLWVDICVQFDENILSRL